MTTRRFEGSRRLTFRGEEGLAQVRSQLREADLFYAELLHGRSRPGRFARPAELDEAMPDRPGLDLQDPDLREPFFGDRPGESWRVVARAGSPLLPATWRSDDLLVRRSRHRRAWRCFLVGDLDERQIVTPEGLLRPGSLLLRRCKSPARGPNGADDFRDDLRSRPAGREDFGEIVEVCGFFGPTGTRTEQAVRDAVVARAEAEWAAWHGPAGAPRQENDNGMFGRLLGYYLAAAPAVLPDTVLALQANALAVANYTPFLTTGIPAVTMTSEITRLRNLLVPGGTQASLAALVETALRQARQAHQDTGAFAAWSAAFVVACVRGAAITSGLEATTPPRLHFGRDGLLTATLAHRVYALAAFRRRTSRPAQRGTYHAFAPAERAPLRGDIIVQDRQATAAADLQDFANIGTMGDLKTHGDIVVDVQPAFVVTVGGNLGGSVRRRRYPLDGQGRLVTTLAQLYTQENATGTLPPLAGPTTATLRSTSTQRIFALLSPIEECAAVPGQPVPGGVLV